MEVDRGIRISVVIPTYNQAQYLPEAIESVLNQGREDVEIIIVNDGSTDETEKVARAYAEHYKDRIAYIAKENGGAASARNAGIRAARGKYIAFLDSDDIYLPGTLTKLSDYLESHPETAFIGGDVYYYDGKETKGRWGRPRNLANYRWETAGFPTPTNTVMVRREVFDHVPLFDERLRNAAEDWLMWVRIARLYNMAFLDEPLTLYRQHGKNTSRQNSVAFHADHRTATQFVISSPEFVDYPNHYRARILYFHTATRWHNTKKTTIAALLLRAFLTDPRQTGYGIRVFRQGISNTWKRLTQRLTSRLTSH